MKLKLLIFILLACIGCDDASGTAKNGYCLKDTFIDTADTWNWDSVCLEVSEKECNRLDDDVQEYNTQEYSSSYYWLDGTCKDSGYTRDCGNGYVAADKECP